MGHVDQRRPRRPLDADKLVLHLAPHLEIERTERLVEQQHRRTLHQRPRQRHALLLTTRELGDPAPFHPRKADEIERLPDPPARARPRDALHFETVGDIALDPQMREQRIALEDGVGGSFIGLAAGDVDAFDLDLSARRIDKSPDDAQRRRLAAAAWSKQREELAAIDRERDADRLGAHGVNVLARIANPQVGAFQDGAAGHGLRSIGV